MGDGTLSRLGVEKGVLVVWGGFPDIKSRVIGSFSEPSPRVPVGADPGGWLVGYGVLTGVG